ncbi:hypothetical protein, partial [Klebsiella pneumoniae]|uniref:hypothetical protein n=1 Tax=Klebsiella pneumoniae TaxID=573 RepID=UPI001C8F4875
MTTADLTYNLSMSVNTSEWPLEFSKSIVNDIKKDILYTDLVGITIDNPFTVDEPHLSFRPSWMLVPEDFSEYFIKAFSHDVALSGILTIKLTTVRIP